MKYYDSFFSGLFGGFIVLVLFLGILILTYAIVLIVATWKLFEKTGKKGWKSIIPIYNYWVLVEIAGLNRWWFLLAIIDVVLKIEFDDLGFAFNICSFLASFNIYYNIAKKFGKDKGISVCAGIFPSIFILIFGFSKKEVYDANVAVSPNGIFGTTEESTTNKNGNYQSNVYDSTLYNNAENITSTDSSQTSNSTINYETKQQIQEFGFCGNCGNKLNKDTKFCPNCGKRKL